MTFNLGGNITYQWYNNYPTDKQQKSFGVRKYDHVEAIKLLDIKNYYFQSGGVAYLLKTIPYSGSQ